MITIVVPIYNEEDNIKSLLEEIAKAAKNVPISEIIYVDDNSTDKSFEVLKKLRKGFPSLRIIKHKTNSGQSAALWTGIKAAGNDIIVTMDGDGQNNPLDVKLLYDKYMENCEQYPKIMIAGERKQRNDSIVRILSSRIANNIRAAILKDKTSDTGCSLKLFRRRDYMNLPYFDHMHRFLPALMIREGVKLEHVKVSHRPRTHGVSKYGTWNRAFVGISDVRGVLWLQKRSRRAEEVYEELD